MAKNVKEAITLLINSEELGHYDMQFVKPLDSELLHRIFRSYKAVITVEDGTVVGGFGSSILSFANTNNYKHPIELMGIKDEFVEHGSVAQLRKLQNLDVQSIKDEIERLLLIVNNC